MNLNRNLTRIIFFSIILIYILYFINYSKIISDWALVELLINYEGGFVRRGLLGQLNLFFENKFNFLNLSFAIAVISFSYLFNIIITYLRLPNNKNRLILFFIIFLSPATFMFYVNDTGAIFRKDVFIILSFVIHSIYVQLNYKKLNFFQDYKKKLYPLMLVLCLITLIHEVQFFMLTFHILLSFSILKKIKSTILFYIFPVLTFVIVWVFNGNYLVAESIRESLNHYPQNLIYQNYNPIHWLEGNLNLVIGGFFKFFFRYDYRQVIELLIAVFLTIVLFWNILFLYFKQFILENRNMSIINLEFLKNHSYKFLFISFCLFFFMGFDAGRALHLLTMHIISFYLIFIPKKKVFVFFNNDNKFKNFIIILLLCYFFLWYLPHGYVGITTIFESGLLHNFKIIFAYIVKIFSNFIFIPTFLIDVTKEYLIFNNAVKF
jgi:hypothetical protein